jgi:predicted permease
MTFRFGPRKRDIPRDVDREIENHLELRAREFEAQGMSPGDARQAALAAFGDRPMIEQEVREIRGNTVRTLQSRQWFHELKQDIGTALRGLRRAPGFAIVALATLALGIGGNVAVFSVVRSVLLRPLPYAEPSQLVQLWTDFRARGSRDQPEWLSPAQFRDWRDGNTTFAGLTVWQGWGPNLTGSGDPELLTGGGVTWNFLDVLGIEPAIGRDFVQADDDAGAAPVVILTDGLWRRRFGADPNIVGQAIQLSGEPWTVVGVLPASFRAPFPWQIIRPMRRPANSGCDRGCITLRGIGRMKPGVTLAQATADLAMIQDRLGREFPEEEAGVKPWLVPLQEQLTGPVRKALVALFGAVGFVLLLACVNLAGLLVVRGGARAREFAVRASLGAGRRRIVRQLVTESLVLASIGGVLGFFAGWGGARLLAALIPANVLLMVDIKPDLAVVLFTIGIAVLAGLLFGLLPAIQAGRADLMAVLRTASGEGGKKISRVRSGLVVVELAIAVMLLVGAGLLMRSFLALQRTDLGYRTSGIVTASLYFPRTTYPRASDIRLRVEDFLVRARGNPEVKAIETADVVPLQAAGDQDMNFFPDGLPVPERPPGVWYRSVSAGYLPLMQFRLLSGRMFTDQDRDGQPMVAIINEEAAKTLFPGLDPVGRTMTNGLDSTADRFTVVGVVASTRTDGPNQPYKLEMFGPLHQFTSRAFNILVEPARNTEAALGAVRAALKEADPSIPLSSVVSLDESFATVTALPRYFAIVLGCFAAMALLLAVVGVYGVMAYVVALRQREIGVRLALGAAPQGIMGWLIGQGARLTMIGLVLGIAAAIVATRVIAALLYGVGALDAITFGGVAVVLATASLVACYLPARRARGVDPMVSLRSE